MDAHVHGVVVHRLLQGHHADVLVGFLGPAAIGVAVGQRPFQTHQGGFFPQGSPQHHQHVALVNFHQSTTHGVGVDRFFGQHHVVVQPSSTHRPVAFRVSAKPTGVVAPTVPLVLARDAGLGPNQIVTQILTPTIPARFRVRVSLQGRQGVGGNPTEQYQGEHKKNTTRTQREHKKNTTKTQRQPKQNNNTTPRQSTCTPPPPPSPSSPGAVAMFRNHHHTHLRQCNPSVLVLTTWWTKPARCNVTSAMCPREGTASVGDPTLLGAMANRLANDHRFWATACTLPLLLRLARAMAPNSWATAALPGPALTELEQAMPEDWSRIPEAVDRPAPVRTTTRRARMISCATLRTNSLCLAGAWW